MEKKWMRHFLGIKSLTCRSLLMIAATGMVLPLLLLDGCGGASTKTTSSSSQQEPQSYFVPWVAGTTNGSGGQLTQLTGTEIYAIDDTADAFSQSIYGLGGSFHLQGPQVINAGGPDSVSKNSRGLLSLGITANYAYSSSSGTYEVTDYSPAKSGSFAFEISGQYGGLAQIVGQPAVPLVVASACPSLSTAQTWLFLTIPGGMTTNSSGKAGAWSPTTDTAYGSAEISTSGSTVTFNNIKQYTLPSIGGTGTPSATATSPTTGVCGSTTLGYTTSVPGYAVATDPGLISLSEASATVGINSTGLLVEDNGILTSGTNTGTYENVLGAGTGAIGLPKPSSALDVSALRSAQYLGFVRGAGVYDAGSISAWSSHLASFSYSSASSGCTSFAAQTGTLSNGIYGGDFTNDDPSTSSDGFGNCDLAIDLGTQDSANNGLFPNAKVWLGSTYAGNTTGKTYSFSVVAIAGKLNGKYAIFLLGVDSTEPWTVYLLQSN
jgi:hypothetical protein